MLGRKWNVGDDKGQAQLLGKAAPLKQATGRVAREVVGGVVLLCVVGASASCLDGNSAFNDHHDAGIDDEALIPDSTPLSFSPDDIAPDAAIAACADDRRCGAPEPAVGSCGDGRCVETHCEPGWANCNGDWRDGCETHVDGDALHCGQCQRPCPQLPNAKPTCADGQCVLVCVPPYDDCNGDASDGCEIPVGRPNSCDRQGLSTFDTAAGATPGCGTAYCGAGGPDDASFGSWHCSFCSHCQRFDDGSAWCLADTGVFSAQRCDCCGPQAEISFLQVCPH